MLYFSQEELNKVKNQRKKHLIIYYSSLVVFAIFTLGNILWYCTLPYKSPTILTVELIQYLVSALFVIYTFLYLGIVYRRVNKYFRVLVDLEKNKKELYSGSFIGYDESMHEHNGVDFKTLTFLEWNKYKKDFFERKVLIPCEKQFPEFTENTNVRYITQSNILISYEILS